MTRGLVQSIDMNVVETDGFSVERQHVGYDRNIVLV